jgi:hypothetical protein
VVLKCCAGISGRMVISSAFIHVLSLW